LANFVKAAGYREIWHPEWSRVEMVDHYEICPGFIALHGDVVSTHAGMSALKMLNKWRINLIHGHTHRLGATGYRVPAVAGKQEHQMRAFEGGCMCRLDPPYLSMANWQNAFSIIRHNKGGNFGIEQVQVVGGEAVIASLGGTYRAAETAGRQRSKGPGRARAR
jgi:hypothetical protein